MGEWPNLVQDFISVEKKMNAFLEGPLTKTKELRHGLLTLKRLASIFQICCL